MKTYTTVQGDMFDSIAYSQLGSVQYADKIMQMNPERVGYFIFPAGITLELPEPTVEAGTSLPPWKKVNG